MYAAHVPAPRHAASLPDSCQPGHGRGTGCTVHRGADGGTASRLLNRPLPAAVARVRRQARVAEATAARAAGLLQLTTRQRCRHQSCATSHTETPRMSGHSRLRVAREAAPSAAPPVECDAGARAGTALRKQAEQTSEARDDERARPLGLQSAHNREMLTRDLAVR